MVEVLAMIAEVKTIRTNTLRDVPAMLRKLADQIESGQWGDAGEVVCCVNHPDDVRIYMWGDSTSISAYALLSRCATKVLETIYETKDEG